MYSDPRLVRDIVLKLRFSDADMERIDALVAKTGQQKAALLRELLLEQVALELTKMEAHETTP